MSVDEDKPSRESLKLNGSTAEYGSNLTPMAPLMTSSSPAAAATVVAASAISAPASASVMGGASAAAAATTKPNTPGMKYRHVGKTGLMVSNLALGSMKLFSSGDPDVSESIVTAAYEKGINLFDVSDPYNYENAECEFGKIFKKKDWPRRNYIVCTKIYWGKSVPGRATHDDRGLSRKEIIESVLQSLKNLQMDYIDLVLISKHDPNCPCEEVVRAMDYLINTGRVMYWGTTRWNHVEVMEAFSSAKQLNLTPPITEMAEYHWFHREKVEVYMGELYNKIGLGLMTWSPVSYGLSIGRPEETSQMLAKMIIKNAKYRESVLIASANAVGNPQMAANASSVGGNNDPNAPGGSSISNALADPHAKVRALEQIAKDLKFDSVSQMCIAWSVKNQTSVTCVSSAATLEQFEEIIASLALVPKMTIPNCEDIEKVLLNKPTRPAMVSTLTQRWAATGGIPPC